MKRTLPKLWLAALAITAVSPALAQTNVPALIQSNQVWDISGSPYQITQNTYIDTGVTVTIMPGVEVVAQSNNLTLDVHGELQALGTQDSMININQLQIELNADAESYDSATGSGALFKYCWFTSPGIGKRVLSINSISIRVEHCIFWNTYYSIYIMSMSQTSPRIELFHNEFNDSTGVSYPIYASGTNHDIIMKENTCNNFGNGGGVYMTAKNLEVKNNVFNGHNHVSFTAKASNISCNLFKHLRSGVEVDIYAQDTVNSCIFTHNTLDSCGSTMINDPMLTVNKHSIYNLNQSRFNNNNFLTLLGYSEKVHINGTNPTPTQSEPVDFKNNYWQSTDSSTIDSFILDYADNINLFGRADFSGYLSAPDSVCDGSGGSSCTASYYLAIDTANLYNLYLIHNSTGTTSSTSYYWDFGDGNSSTDQTPSHTYQDFGKYKVCLTISNSSQNCYSTYCDSIGLDSLGNLLKKGGFTITVLADSTLMGVKGNTGQGEILVYPNPSGGQLFIEFSSVSAQRTRISVLDLTGREVYVSEAGISAEGHALDLSHLKEGLYLLHVQQGTERYTTKIIISK